MAHGKKNHTRATQKKQAQRRKKQLSKTLVPVPKQLSRKLELKLAEAYEMIENSQFDDAKQVLDRLNKNHPRHSAIVEAQVCLYQNTNDHRNGCFAAKNLLQLTPRDPDAQLIYAQEAMFCGWIGIAQQGYRRFLHRWPDHANATRAENAMALLEPAIEEKIADLKFENPSLDLLIKHEQIMEAMQTGEFVSAIPKCLDLIELESNWMPARNNLATLYFQTGDCQKALTLTQQTCHIAPDNQYARISLARFHFLSGRETQAMEMTDQILTNPPTAEKPDPLAALAELLSFLGRDTDIVTLISSINMREIPDPNCAGQLLHFLAVAQFRLGNLNAAESSWKKCLKYMPAHPNACENLRDIENGEGHAAWFDSCSKWLPRPVLDKMFDDATSSGGSENLELFKNHPAIASLIPALLDRGDPLARKLAIRMAKSDGSPKMIDSIYQFATGQRGPDKMRLEALHFLLNNDYIGSGQHRLFFDGKYTDIELWHPEIHFDATVTASPEIQSLSAEGQDAMAIENFEAAEIAFQKVLSIDPDNKSATFNLTGVWLKRDGKDGLRRAVAKMEEMLEQHPDYLFPGLTLAQLAANDGDLKRAAELIRPASKVKRLHVSEAKSLFAAQVQISIGHRNFASAEMGMSMLEEMLGHDDPVVPALRQKINLAKRKNSTRGLLGDW